MITNTIVGVPYCAYSIIYTTAYSNYSVPYIRGFYIIVNRVPSRALRRVLQYLEGRGT